MECLIKVMLIAWLGGVICYDDYQPRTYVLHLEHRTWMEAVYICEQEAGHIAIVYDINTIPDLLLGKYFTGDSVFWIGLNQSQPGEWRWWNGSEVTWSNWRHSHILFDPLPGDCAVALGTSFPYWWMESNCNKQHPFLCQVEGGSCRFDVYPNSSLPGHNILFEDNKAPEECESICLNTTDFQCSSFEYNPKYLFCQFNAGDRWTQHRDYADYADPEWRYYHYTCYTGRVAGLEEVTSSFVESSTPSSHYSPTPYIEFLTTVCSSVWITQTVTFTAHTAFPTTTSIFYNETVASSAYTPSTSLLPQSSFIPPPALPDPITEELKVIGVALRQRKKQQSKSTTYDSRPSATYVGYVAIGVMSAIFGSLILIDLLTACRQVPALKYKTSVKSLYQWSAEMYLDQPPPPNIKKASTSEVTKRKEIKAVHTDKKEVFFTVDDARVWQQKQWGVTPEQKTSSQSPVSSGMIDYERNWDKIERESDIDNGSFEPRTMHSFNNGAFDSDIDLEAVVVHQEKDLSDGESGEFQSHDMERICTENIQCGPDPASLFKNHQDDTKFVVDDSVRDNHGKCSNHKELGSVAKDQSSNLESTEHSSELGHSEHPLSKQENINSNDQQQATEQVESSDALPDRTHLNKASGSELRIYGSSKDQKDEHLADKSVQDYVGSDQVFSIM